MRPHFEFGSGALRKKKLHPLTFSDGWKGIWAKGERWWVLMGTFAMRSAEARSLNHYLSAVMCKKSNTGFCKFYFQNPFVKCWICQKTIDLTVHCPMFILLLSSGCASSYKDVQQNFACTNNYAIIHAYKYQRSAKKAVKNGSTAT